MKTNNLLKIFLFIAIATIFACSSSEDSGDGGGNGDGVTSITLTSDALFADYGTPFSFTVKTNQGTDVTASATITVAGSAISGNTFLPPNTGEYVVTATYESYTSGQITVTSLPVLVSIDIESNSSTVNIGETVEYTVIGTDNDGNTSAVTSASTVFVDGAESATGNRFIPGATGTIQAYATLNGMTSSTIDVTVEDNAMTPASFTQRALIEDYTGTWCGWCPRVSYGIEQVEAATDNAVIVAVHAGDEMSTSYGNQLIGQYNPSGSYPTAIVNRTTEWTYPEPDNVSQITNAAQGTTNTGIAINSAIKANNISVVVSSGFSQNVSGAKLVIMLLEDGLVYDQVNYTSYYGGGAEIANFVHDNVLRYSFTNVLGDAVPGGEAVANNTYHVKYDFTIPSGIVSNPNNLEIVAMIVNSSNQMINVNTAELGVEAAFD